MVFMWPIVAVPAMGVYESPEDLPEEAVEDNTYSIIGTVDQAHTEGDYTVMVIEFKDNKFLGWVEEGEFNEGETVLFNLKCTDEGDWEDSMEDDDDDNGDDGFEESYWDDWFDTAKELDEDDLETFDEYMDDAMEGSGVEAEVTKPPMIGGIIGLIILIVGVILLVLGLLKKSKAKKSYAPQSPAPQYQQPPPQQSQYSPPQQQYQQSPPPQQPYYPPPPQQQQPPQQQW